MIFVSNRHIEAWRGGGVCRVWTLWCSAARLRCSDQSVPQWQLALCHRPPTDALQRWRCVQNICRDIRASRKVFPDEIQQWSVLSRFCFSILSYNCLLHCLVNKKHLKNVGPIRHCEPPHTHSPGVASDTVARRLHIDVHDNDNVWQRGPLWSHGMGPIKATLSWHRCACATCYVTAIVIIHKD